MTSLTSQSLSDPMKVRALYYFDADEADVSNFDALTRAGEIIVVSDCSNANWWSRGVNLRGGGLIPTKYAPIVQDHLTN